MTSYACHADSWTHVSPHWTANLGSKPTLDPRFPARDGKRGPAHSIPHSTHVSPHATGNLGSKPTLDPRLPARDGKRAPAHSIPPSTTATQPQDFDFDSTCNMLHISERRIACQKCW